VRAAVAIATASRDTRNARVSDAVYVVDIVNVAYNLTPHLVSPTFERHILFLVIIFRPIYHIFSATLTVFANV
jgi:hypothetical protein